MAKKTKAELKKEEKKQKEQLPPIHCKGCDVNFTPKDKRERFHSPRCREDFYERTYFTGPPVHKICPNCGSDFITTKPGRQEYCLPECREEAKQKRKEGLATGVVDEHNALLGIRYRTLQHDVFKCTTCGRGAADGVKLDVEQIEGTQDYHTVCNECVLGRKIHSGGPDSI